MEEKHIQYINVFKSVAHTLPDWAHTTKTIFPKKNHPGGENYSVTIGDDGRIMSVVIFPSFLDSPQEKQIMLSAEIAVLFHISPLIHAFNNVVDIAQLNPDAEHFASLMFKRVLSGVVEGLSNQIASIPTMEMLHHLRNALDDAIDRQDEEWVEIPMVGMKPVKGEA